MRTIIFGLLATTAIAGAAHAATPAAVPADSAVVDGGDATEEIVVTSRRVRAVSEIEGPQIQEILPGISR